ncbi:EamA family transporter [Aeromonas media]|uniref:EamA family transporter n=2 Tax=Aeromonas media TaxID=651 RepID=UPI0039A5EAAA
MRVSKNWVKFNKMFTLSPWHLPKVSVLFYLVPILTMFFDFIIFDTEITTTTIMGALIVIASIKLFSLPSRRASEKMLS